MEDLLAGRYRSVVCAVNNHDNSHGIISQLARLMPTSPADYIPRFCSELKLSGDVQAKTIEILKQAADKELTSGRGPMGVAAAAIYIASILSGERRTQREVAEVAGVTEVTIRNRYKELAERLDIDIVL